MLNFAGLIAGPAGVCQFAARMLRKNARIRELNNITEKIINNCCFCCCIGLKCIYKYNNINKWKSYCLYIDIVEETIIYILYI